MLKIMDVYLDVKKFKFNVNILYDIINNLY